MQKLVLLPGFDGTGRLFDPFIQALGPDFESTVAAYPGDLPLGYDDLEKIARSFLPRDEPFTLLAESFSGPIAISIAASKPPGLKCLILCCSFARTPRPRMLRAIAALRLAPLGVAVNRFSASLLFGRFGSAELRASLKEALVDLSSRAITARTEALATVDVSSKLRAVDVPILYLRATEDRLVTKSSFQRISEWAPHAKLVELDAPHLLLQTVPVEAAAVVRAFIHQALREPAAPSAGGAALS